MKKQTLKKLACELCQTEEAQNLAAYKGYWGGGKYSRDSEEKSLKFENDLVSFAENCGIRYYGESYYYFFNDSQVWENISGNKDADDVLVMIYNEVMRQLEIPSTRTVDKHFRKECFIDIIKMDPMVPDWNIWAFTNGVIDIRERLSGHVDCLRPFSKEYPVVSQLPFPYNPEAEGPLWNKFISESLPDRTRRSLVQMFLGTAAFVPAKEANAETGLYLYVYGSGGNGKSVIAKVMAGVIGREAILPMGYDQLVRSGHDGDVMRTSLEGKKLLYMTDANNIDVGRPKESALWKSILSAEDQMVRANFDRKPSVLSDIPWVAVNSNGLPCNMKSENNNMRRMLFINMENSVSNDEKDTQLDKKIIAHEASAVFNWLVEGACQLKQLGWKFPKSPDNEKVWDVIDPMRAWMREVHVSPTATVSGEEPEWVQSTELMAAYYDYRLQYDLSTKSSLRKDCSAKRFGDEMKHRGFGQKEINWTHNRDGNFYRIYGYTGQPSAEALAIARNLA